MATEAAASLLVTAEPPITAIQLYTELTPTFNTTDNTAHMVFGSITMIVSIATLLGDTFLLFYFYTQKNKISSQIYLYLLVCDMVLSLNGVYIAFEMLLYNTEEVTMRHKESQREVINIHDTFSVFSTYLERGREGEKERGHDNTAHMVFGSITMIVSIATLLGDTFLLFYFYTQKNKISSQIYLYLLVCDMVLSLNGVYIAFEMLLYNTEEVTMRHKESQREVINIHDTFSIQTHSSLRYINSYIYAVVSRMSCMINCYLSVVRAIVIMLPFTTIKGVVVMVMLVVYNVVLATVILVCFIMEEPECSHRWMLCEPSLPTNNSLVDVVVLTGIPYVLPCLPVIISCALIIYKQITMPEFGEKMKSGTVTIVYVSILFVVCNSIFFITAFSQYSLFFGKGDPMTDPNADFTNLADIGLSFGVRTFSTIFNAFGNVGILLWRSSGVITFTKQFLRREITLAGILRPQKTNTPAILSVGRGNASPATDVTSPRRGSRVSVLTSPVSPIVVQAAIRWQANTASNRELGRVKEDSSRSSRERDQDCSSREKEDCSSRERDQDCSKKSSRDQDTRDNEKEDDDDLWGYNLSSDESVSN
eukprot:sb/3463267/